MLIQFECGNVACYRPTLVNAASRVKSCVKSFVGVETGIIILSSAQYNDAAKQVSASTRPVGQAFSRTPPAKSSLPPLGQPRSVTDYRGLTQLARPRRE